MISLSVTGSTSHLDELNSQNQNQGGYQHHQTQNNGGMQLGDMQNGMGSGMMWDTGNDEDGEGEFDGFTLGDAVSQLTSLTSVRLI